MASHVFICYRSTDRAYVEKLATHLRAAGVAVWYDADSRAGERLNREIKKQIDTCAAFIVVMTPEAGDSDWVTAEVDLAQSLKKKILPLLLRGRDRFERSDMFFSLRATQYDDVSGGELPDTIVERLRQLGVRVTPPPHESTLRRANPAGLAAVVGAALAVVLIASALWAFQSRPSNTGPDGTLTGHTGPVEGVAWSPDGTHLATASRDNTAIIWDATTGQRIRTLSGTGFMNGVGWSPDGTKVATASSDNTAIVWDATTGRPILTLTGHTDTVFAVAWSPNGARLATASRDSTAIIWDAGTGQPARTLTHTYTGYGNSGLGVAWSPDGTRLATAINATVIIWDADTGLQIRTLTGPEHANAVAWSPDGTRLATASWDETAIIWDAGSGQKIRTLAGHTDTVFAVAWSPDGARLATASRDSTAIIWDATTGDEIRALTGHTNTVLGVAWSPDGTRLATAGWDNTARIWAL